MDRQVVLKRHRWLCLVITALDVIMTVVSLRLHNGIAEAASGLMVIPVMLVWWSYGVAKELDG